MPNRLSKMEVDELSFVDSPAEPNAKVALFKRDEEGEADEMWLEEVLELGKAQPTSTQVVGGNPKKKKGPRIRLRGNRDEDEDDGDNPGPYRSSHNRYRKAGTVGSVYEAEIHRHFTNMADGMYANGNLTKEERVALSNAIGGALDAFSDRVRDEHPQLYTRSPHEDMNGDVDKRDFSIEQRRQFANRGVALPDGSYPIPDADALRRAIQAYGRSRPEKRAQVVAHIRRRAKALNQEDMVPDSFKKLEGWEEGQGEDGPPPVKVSKQMEGNMPQGDTQTELDLSALPVEVGEAVAQYIADLTKRAEEAEAEVELLRSDEGQGEGEEDDILKNADPAIRKIVEDANAKAAEAEAIAKAERDARLNREFIAKAESFSFIPGETEQRASILKAASAAMSPEDYEALEETFRSVNELISKSALLKSAGSGQADEDTPMGRIENMAKARASEKEISYEQAYEEVLDENPDLYAETVEEAS